MQPALVPVRTSNGPVHCWPVCPRCHSRFDPHSAAVRGCTVCTRYTSLLHNARKTRRDGSSPGIELTLEQFATWFAHQPRECTYCSIPENLLAELNIRTQTAQRLQRLGVDRLDSSQGYLPDNMVLCCFACNKAKSNTFTGREMLLVGRGVAASWERRLEHTWRPCPLRPDPLRTRTDRTALEHEVRTDHCDLIPVT